MAKKIKIPLNKGETIIEQGTIGKVGVSVNDWADEKVKEWRGSLVCKIADGLDATIDGRGMSEEGQAAIRLANAAPDLLAALKAAHDALLMDRYGRYSRAVEMAAKAIEKAEKGE